MPKLHSSSILSRALPRGATRFRAIALIETLIAAAVLSSAALAFLFVFKEARTDLARAKRQTEAAALAQHLLADAQQTWLTGPFVGQSASMTWRRRCAAVQDASSPRLILVRCSVSIQLDASSQATQVTLESTWPQERPGARPL